jgi:hypothetical protein
MKKLLLIPLFTSCVIHKQYSPIKLKKISNDMETLREWLQNDYDDGKIEKGTAQNYFNLMETYAYDLNKEYNKAKKLEKTKVYKLITITKR